MRTILIFITLALATSAGMVIRAHGSLQQEVTVPQDSMVDVIAWLSKNDTLDYVIKTSEWKITPDDTITTLGISSKVRIVVTDSTSTGYKMDYTFMDSRLDTVEESPLGTYAQAMMEKLNKKIAGTTVHFETDEFGCITRITNLNEIRKRATSLYKDAVREILALDEVKEMKKAGVDFSKEMKEIDTDQLVESYLEELKLIFVYNGNSIKIGETTEHEYATDSTYMNDSYVGVSADPGDGSYEIVSQVDNIIPKDELRILVGDFLDEVSDDSTDISGYINKAIDTNAIHTSYLDVKYMTVGLPYKIVKQETTTLRNRGKCEQTVIILDDYRY